MPIEIVLTCPHCDYKQTETASPDKCLTFYRCQNCHKELATKEGMCCVHCSYGDKKCPLAEKAINKK